MVANAGEFRAPMVFKSNSAGWRRNGRKMHAESRIVLLVKMRKNANFGENMDFLALARKFG